MNSTNYLCEEIMRNKYKDACRSNLVEYHIRVTLIFDQIENEKMKILYIISKPNS